MSRGRVGVCLGVAIAVAALLWGRGVDAGASASRDGDRGSLIRNASVVLTMDPTLGDGILGRLDDADVRIVGDEIAAVGDLERPPSGTRVIDGRGKIVMPGFVDTHDHLWQSLIRGCATDAGVSDWFPRCGSPLFTYQFSKSDAYALVRLSTTGLIGTGVTTVVDWSHSFNADIRSRQPRRPQRLQAPVRVRHERAHCGGRPRRRVGQGGVHRSEPARHAPDRRPRRAPSRCKRRPRLRRSSA